MSDDAPATTGLAGTAAASHRRTVGTSCKVTAQTPAIVNGQLRGVGTVRCSTKRTAVVTVSLMQFIDDRWTAIAEENRVMTLRAGRTYTVKTGETQCLPGPVLTPTKTHVTVKIPKRHWTKESPTVDLDC
jgi:hypothetical protein